jgi:hypothetical protein
MIRTGTYLGALSVSLAITSVACVGLKDGDMPASESDSGFDSRQSDSGSSEDAGGQRSADGSSDATTGPHAAPSDSAAADASDDDFDAGAGAIESDAPELPLPVATAPGHLRLWLTAQAGVRCSSGRVTTWADQSGNHDDAILKRGQLGPQCQIVSNPHSVDGVDLPYFSAPESDASPNVLDETLDVDLSFLAKTDYTFFTVERRWADAMGKEQELIFGTTMPVAVEQMARTDCTAISRNIAVVFGYVDYGNSAVSVTLDQSCNSLMAGANPVPAGSPAPLSEHAGQFNAAWGHQIWENGVPMAIDSDTSPLSTASDGAIGRALVQTTILGVDPRFRGDIAEVIVYDTALSDSDRAAVDTYLTNRWQVDGGL